MSIRDVLIFLIYISFYSTLSGKNVFLHDSVSEKIFKIGNSGGRDVVVSDPGKIISNIISSESHLIAIREFDKKYEIVFWNIGTYNIDKKINPENCPNNIKAIAKYDHYILISGKYKGEYVIWVLNTHHSEPKCEDQWMIRDPWNILFLSARENYFMWVSTNGPKENPRMWAINIFDESESDNSTLMTYENEEIIGMDLKDNMLYLSIAYNKKGRIDVWNLKNSRTELILKETLISGLSQIGAIQILGNSVFFDGGGILKSVSFDWTTNNETTFLQSQTKISFFSDISSMTTASSSSLFLFSSFSFSFNSPFTFTLLFVVYLFPFVIIF